MLARVRLSFGDDTYACDIANAQFCFSVTCARVWRASQWCHKKTYNFQRTLPHSSVSVVRYEWQPQHRPYLFQVCQVVYTRFFLRITSRFSFDMCIFDLLIVFDVARFLKSLALFLAIIPFQESYDIWRRRQFLLPGKNREAKGFRTRSTLQLHQQRQLRGPWELRRCWAQ